MPENFKDKYPLQQRKELSQKLKEKYPNRIPIIVEKGNKRTPDISKHKFLAPEDINIGKFILEIRNHLPLNATQAIFVSTNKKILKPSATLAAIYELEKDADGFLYLTYMMENTFGSFSC
jgi:GABA(A) receptor-associated protein